MEEEIFEDFSFEQVSYEFQKDIVRVMTHTLNKHGKIRGIEFSLDGSCSNITINVTGLDGYDWAYIKYIGSKESGSFRLRFENRDGVNHGIQEEWDC